MAVTTSAPRERGATNSGDPLLPYRRQLILSPLPAAAAQQRITDLVDWAPSWFSLLRGFASRGKYFGRAVSGGFVLVRGRWFVNTYRPVVRVRIASTSAGTSIEIAAYAPGVLLPVAALAPLMFIGARNGQWSIVGGMFLVLLVFHCVSWFFFDLERRDIVRQLSRLTSKASA